MAARSGADSGHGLWPYVQMARVDHWFKNAFMLLGVIVALFVEPSLLRWDVRAAAAARAARHLPRRVEQLRAQRDARRALRPQAPGEEAPARGGRAGAPALGAGGVARARRARLGLALARERLVRSRRRPRALGHGRALQREADPHQGAALPRRAVGVGQQPDPAVPRLVPADPGPRTPALAGALLLDGRSLLHGAEALRRVPRRSATARRRSATGAPSGTTTRSGCW